MMLGAPHTYGKVLEMHGSSIKIYAPLLLLVTSDYCHIVIKIMITSQFLTRLLEINYFIIKSLAS